MNELRKKRINIGQIYNWKKELLLKLKIGIKNEELDCFLKEFYNEIITRFQKYLEIFLQNNDLIFLVTAYLNSHGLKNYRHLKKRKYKD